MSRALMTGLAGIGLAQLLKVPTAYRRTGSWDWSQLSGTGGMPSSHSAGTAALATYIAMRKGIASIDFAISTLFGLIVMYDAMGIRRHAGEMAVELNALDVQIEKLSSSHPGAEHQRREEALKEQLGHMPREVLGGAVVGIATGIVSYWAENRMLRRGRRS